jgi:hypothetical protein
MRATLKILNLSLIIGLLLATGCSKSDVPTTPADLVGLWKLDRPSSERREWGSEYLRFTDEGYMIWGTSKGATTTGTKAFRYQVEGEGTILLDPPPSPDAQRVEFSFNGRGWLIVRIGERELRYRRQQD